MFSFLELRLVRSLPKYVISDARPGFEANFKQQPYSEEFVRFEGFEVSKLADNQYFFASLIRSGMIQDSQIRAYVRAHHHYQGWLNDLERKRLYHYAVICCQNLSNADLEQLLIPQLERLAGHAQAEVLALFEQRNELNQHLLQLVAECASEQVAAWQEQLQLDLPQLAELEQICAQLQQLVASDQSLPPYTGQHPQYRQAVLQEEAQLYAWLECLEHLFALEQVAQIIPELERAGKQLDAAQQRTFAYLRKQAELWQQLGVVAYTRQSLFFSNSKFFADGYVVHPNQVIINATVSHLLLYQQVYVDTSIAPSDWILIADQTLVLAPDWRYRLEKLFERLPQIAQYPDHRSLLALVSLANKYHNQIAVDQWGLYDLAKGVHYDASEDEQILLTLEHAGCNGTHLYLKTEVTPADGNQVYARLNFLKSISFSGYSFYMFKRQALKQPSFPAMGLVDAFHQTFQLHNGSLGNYQPALGANAYFNETMFLSKEQVDELHLARLHAPGFNYARMAVYRQGYDYLATYKQFVLAPTPSLHAQPLNRYLNSHSLHYYGLFTASSLRAHYNNWQVVPRYWLVSDLNDSRLYFHADEMLDFLAQDSKHFEKVQCELDSSFVSRLPDSVTRRIAVQARQQFSLPTTAQDWQQNQQTELLFQRERFCDAWGMPCLAQQELGSRKFYSEANFTSSRTQKMMREALEQPTYGQGYASLDPQLLTYHEMEGYRLNYPLSRLEAQWYRSHHYTQRAYIAWRFGELVDYVATQNGNAVALHTHAMHAEYARTRALRQDLPLSHEQARATPEQLLRHNLRPQELVAPYQVELTQLQLAAIDKPLPQAVSASFKTPRELDSATQADCLDSLAGDRFLGKASLAFAGHALLQLQDHYNLLGNLTHRFFSQEDTKNFRIFPCDSGYLLAPLGSPAHDQGLAQNLTYLFTKIANDQTIDPNDFVLVTQLNTYLTEYWYSKVNRLLDYQHLYNRHGQDWDVDLYLLGYEGLEIRREYSSEDLRAAFGKLGDYVDAFNFPKTDLTRFYYGRAVHGYNVSAGLQMVTLSSTNAQQVQFRLSKAPAFLIRKQAILDNFCRAQTVPMRASGSSGTFFARVPLVSYSVDMQLVARWLAGEVELPRANNPEQRNSLAGKRMLLAIPPLAAFYHPTGLY